MTGAGNMWGHVYRASETFASRSVLLIDSPSNGIIQLLNYPKQRRTSCIVKALFHSSASVRVILPFTVTSNHATVTVLPTKHFLICGCFNEHKGQHFLFGPRASTPHWDLCGHKGLWYFFLVLCRSGQGHFVLEITVTNRHACRTSASVWLKNFLSLLFVEPSASGKSDSIQWLSQYSIHHQVPP